MRSKEWLKAESEAMRQRMLYRKKKSSVVVSKEIRKSGKCKRSNVKISGEIYIVRNNVNDKVYIGLTRVGSKKRWKEHVKKSRSSNSRFAQAIREIGERNFHVSVICRCSTESDLLKQEYYYIKEFDSCNPAKGYNTLHFSSSTNEGNVFKRRAEEECFSIFLYFGAKDKDTDIISLFNSQINVCRSNHEVVKQRLIKMYRSSRYNKLAVRFICRKISEKMELDVCGDHVFVYRKKDGSVAKAIPFTKSWEDYEHHRKESRMFRGNSIGSYKSVSAVA